MKLTTLRPKLSQVPSRVPTLTQRPGATERLRGRAAVERRAQFLYRHPLCIECQKVDRVSAATVPDHILPLWAGGADDLEANGQALCHEHHDAKSACEARMRAAGGWISLPCVCGMHSHAGTVAEGPPLDRIV